MFRFPPYKSLLCALLGEYVITTTGLLCWRTVPHVHVAHMEYTCTLLCMCARQGLNWKWHKFFERRYLLYTKCNSRGHMYTCTCMCTRTLSSSPSLDETLLRIRGLPVCFQCTYMYMYNATMFDGYHWRTVNLFVVQALERERERERESTCFPQWLVSRHPREAAASPPPPAQCVPSCLMKTI